ncbi:hypothetical protein HA402_006155 [Bradysia odoriphaga]|nr:hypothetical protein HA402_006155 [Bradysia odoriphaga]
MESESNNNLELAHKESTTEKSNCQDDQTQKNEGNESTTEKNSNNLNDQNQKNDSEEAFDLYMIDLMDVFRRGVKMGFLVKQGDNYHWNLDGNCMLGRDSVN